ncbi:MAG: hypothetical protein QM808_16275 [Steroidobacteraceae bacterium]
MKLGNIETGRLAPTELINKLLHGLAASPEGQKIIQDHNTAIAVERKARWATLKSAEEKFTKQRAQVQVELNELEEKERAARAVLENFEQKLNVARSKFSTIHDEFVNTRTEIEAELRRGADPAIIDCMAWLELQSNESGRLIRSWELNQKDFTGMAYKVLSNMEAMNSYGRLLLDMRDRCERLKSEYHENLHVELQSIRDRVIEAAANAVRTPVGVSVRRVIRH